MGYFALSIFLYKVFIKSLILSGSDGTTMQLRYAWTTTWTSFALTTHWAKCHHRMPSATCSTWWNAKTTNPAAHNPMTRCAGNAATLSPHTHPRSSQRSSSASRHSLWEKSSDRARATTTSVSIGLTKVSLHLSYECNIYGGSFWRMVRGGNAFEHPKTHYRFIAPQTMRWMLTLWVIFEPSFSTTVMNTFQFMLWTAKLAAKPLRVFLASP